MSIATNVNAAGLEQIRRFLEAEHVRGADLYAPDHPMLADMLAAWAQKAEFQLGEGNPARIELRAFESITGAAQEFEVSPDGLDYATNYAIFDTNAGFLLWIGLAADAEAAIRAADEAVGLADDSILLIEVTPNQASALEQWADAGSKSPDYPQGLESGVEYTAEEVAEALAA